MGILDDDIARVRDATDIVGIIGEHVQLKRVGRRWSGLCPFHAEKSPSFSVNQEQGLYYCFGCGAKGDVITFVREIDHLDFVGAVEKLASRAGYALHYTDANEGEGRKRRAELLAAVERAVGWYHERLLSAPDAARARGYLRSRGITGDEVRRYRLGWAPDAWDSLAKALRVPADVFVEAGLGFLNSRRSPTDAFRGRILFPIFDANGDAVGFGGRVLPGADGSKYKNSSESAVYAKSRVLYGLNWAKAEIVAADEVIVCEGYTDVIGFAAAGVPTAIATCGTALTDEHVRILRSFARRVILAFDADAAGQNAAERFYAWERAYDLDVAVAALPAGVDPGDLARSDPDALRDAVASAIPFLGFRVDRVLGAADLSSPEGRARAAEQAMVVVGEHPSDLVRDQYLMEIASRCRIDPARLRSGSFRPPSPQPGRSRSGGRIVPVDRGSSVRRPSTRPDGPETEALRLLVTRRDEIVEWLDEVLFADGLSLAAYRALAATESLRDAIEAADPGARELLERVAVEDSDAEPTDVVARLVDEATSRALLELESESRASEFEDFASYARKSAWLKLRSEELREPSTSLGAMEQLLAWLTQRPEEFG